ncbi:hypothetical protein KKE78_03325 [Patescibacteria group bacterium]|nr:hypothetical protein [Patescibacteria group bacterium]
MLSKSPYKIGLGPKTLSRARRILGSLLLLLTVVIVAGIHQGVASGDFDKVLFKPFREFGSDFEKAVNSPPSPVASPSATLRSSDPSSTPFVKKTVPPQQTKPVVASCIRKNIREGEFASNKCYSQQDFEDLQYYLQRYNSAVFDLQAANGSMRITCNCRVQQECDFFKQSCEDDKNKKTQAESDIEKYKGIIQGIIARGK